MRFLFEILIVALAVAAIGGFAIGELDVEGWSETLVAKARAFGPEPLGADVASTDAAPEPEVVADADETAATRTETGALGGSESPPASTPETAAGDVASSEPMPETEATQHAEVPAEPGLKTSASAADRVPASVAPMQHREVSAVIKRLGRVSRLAALGRHESDSGAAEAANE